MRHQQTQSRRHPRAPHDWTANARRVVCRLLAAAAPHRPAAAPCAGLEPLEPRILLSGNLSVAVSGTTLKVTGDAQNNQIVIDGSSGNLVLSG